MAPEAQSADSKPSTEEMTAHVEKYAAAHSAGDIDGIVALFAEDAVVVDPVDQPAYVGREAFRGFFVGAHDISDSMELLITGPVRVAGVFAAVPLRAVSTIGDIKVAVDIIDVFTFGDDGQFVDMKAYWDPAAMITLD